MICKNCGTDNPEQSIFCNHCGQLLTDQPVFQPEQASAMPQSMQDTPEEVQLTMPEETEEPKHSPQPVIVAMLLLLAIIGLAAGVIYYMARDKQPEESSHDSNTLVIDLITTTTHTQPVMTTIASTTTTEITTATTVTTQPEEVTTEAATTTAPTITTDAPPQNTKPAKTTAPGTKPDTGVTALRPANPLPLSSVTGDWTMSPDDLGLEESMQAILTIGTNGKLTLKISTNGQEMMSDSLPYSYDPDTHLLQAVQNGETDYLYLELTNSNTLRLYSYDLSTGINLTDFVIMVRQ